MARRGKQAHGRSGTRTLLICSEEASAYARLVRAAGLPGLRIRIARGVRELRSGLRLAHLLLAEPHRVAPYLDRAPVLQWVQSTWAGVEQLIEPCRRLGVSLTGVRGIFGPPICEYVMAYVLAIERRLFEAKEDQRRRRWRPRPYRSLQGLTMGVMGMGSIGRQVADMAARFGMNVRGLRRRGGPVRGRASVYGLQRQKEFLRGLDYLVAALPLTPQTEALFERRFFRLLGKQTVFINVGRGAQMVEEDLIKALRAGRLRGAVLDVFQREPLASSSPLWRLPGVHLTPHNAAKSFPEQVAPIFIDNYRRFVRGRALRHRVDLDRGY
ncbi:MAG: D-2-hydroxyacid dehydrogenase [Acidobacteriota bacterium]